LEVRVNEPRARRAGVTNRDVAVSLQTALSGYATTQYREGDKLIPVVLRSSAAYRDDIDKLESLNVYAQASGRNVPLKQVADIELAFSPSKIVRRNRTRTVVVHAGLDPTAGLTAFDVVPEIDAWLKPESQTWPVGYSYEYGGEIESSGEAQASIGAKLPIAVMIIVLLLVGQFNSIRKPIIILLTIPLGIIGVVIGLLLTGKEFGFVTLLGIISLAGIVINNAIVLIDRIQLEIDVNGLSPARAVIEASQRRLRPILLTTGTTVGGLVPLWLGGGPLFESMAVAILFGLLFATVLTLVFVPTLYGLFFRVDFREA
ncbi:MAG TPA: efflux RND transporter permease subunit, partial [Rhodothermia bacterium]